jgi:hypothetical protein
VSFVWRGNDIENAVFWGFAVQYIGTNVLEEQTASLFRV